jgi:leucyl-tRNA synthetase
MTQFGAQTAFRRTLSFVEEVVLKEIAPYIKKSLALADVEILSVNDALAKTNEPGYTKNIIDTSEPGNPAFEYHNV